MPFLPPNQQRQSTEGQRCRVTVLGKLFTPIVSHVTCRLTAKNRDQLRNPTLDNRVWATFTVFLLQQLVIPWRPDAALCRSIHAASLGCRVSSSPALATVQSMLTSCPRSTSTRGGSRFTNHGRQPTPLVRHRSDSVQPCTQRKQVDSRRRPPVSDAPAGSF